jgi:hypothetical protein
MRPYAASATAREQTPCWIGRRSRFPEPANDALVRAFSAKHCELTLDVETPLTHSRVARGLPGSCKR